MTSAQTIRIPDLINVCMSRGAQAVVHYEHTTGTVWMYAESGPKRIGTAAIDKRGCTVIREGVFA